MALTNPYPIGTIVRASGYALESKRQYWLAQGEHAKKIRARQWYDDDAAKRGTITGSNHCGYDVQWHDGSRSSCMAHMVTIAND